MRPPRQTMTAVARLLLVVLMGAGCTDPGGARPSATGQDRPSPTSAGAEAVDFGAVDRTVDRYVRTAGLNGAGLVVVDRRRGVVHEHYTGVFGPDRVSLIASSSKMLTAGVLLRLADEGRLDLDAPVADVVPWGAAHPDITPAQLLSNSSGLVGLGPEPTFPPYLCQYLAAGTLQGCAAQVFTTPDDDPRVVPPDTGFRYGGAQWQVAGAVAEAASGRTWAQLVEETYVRPCRLRTLAYGNHFAQVSSSKGTFVYPDRVDGDPAGVLRPTENPNMEGGAWTTPRDYARLLLMHLRGGRCGGERVLSRAALDRMHSDRIGPAYGGATDSPRLRGYGLGWWVDRDRPSYVEDGGAYGAVPWLDLQRGYGAYLVVEATSRDGTRLAGRIRPLVDERIDRLHRSGG